MRGVGLVARNAFFAVALAVSIVVGRASRLEQSDIALIWPAAGVAAVWMLRARGRGEVVSSAAVLTGCAWLTTWLTGVGAGLSLGFAFVNLIIGWGTALLLNLRGGARLREPADLAWILFCVAAATGVAAVFGGVLLHVFLGGPVWSSTFMFWARNGVTTFLGITLLATLPARLRLPRLPVGPGEPSPRGRATAAPRGWSVSSLTGRRLAEDLAVWVFAVGVYALVFVVNAGSPLAYFVLPVGVLIALRWSTTVCVWHMFASEVFILVATVHDRGPFLSADPVMRAILAQGLIGCALLIVLTVALYRDSRDRLLADLQTAHREVKDAAARLHHSAMHDPLTGLANRQQLVQVLTRELDVATESGARLGVIFLDLNGFKAVNDTYGHAEGDLLLDAVATRLRAFLRSGDFVARLGGDEFVMVCPGLDVPGQLKGISVRLAAKLQEPYALSSGRTHLGISASLGTAESSPHSTVDELIHDADNAMYVDKRARQAGTSAASLTT